VNKDEINKIKDYLEGKMSPEERYALEKESLDDPFLLDALEGLEALPSWPTEVKNIDSLIQKRTENKAKVLWIIWRPISIAASVLLIVGFGLYYFFKGPTKPPIIPLSKIQKKPSTHIVLNPPNPESGSIFKKSKPSPSLIAQSSTEKKASIPNEPVKEDLKKYASDEAKVDFPGAVARVIPRELPDTSNTMADKALALKTSKQNAQEEEKKAPILVSRTLIRVPSASAASNNANGLLSAKTKGLSITETNGILRKSRLGSDSSKDLSEVVITMNGAPLDKNEDTTFPIPEGGIDHFHQYVLTEIKKDTDFHGSVTLEFEVLPNGKIDHIKVINSSNKKLNNKAKKILLNGPVWKGSPTGQSKTLEEEIKFP